MISLTRHTLQAAALATCVACASAAPEARYKDALVHKFDGDARGYYTGLIAVAHDAPNTRAGRRARATLRGGDLSDVATLGVLAALAMPQYAASTAASAGSAQNEAKDSLRAIGEAQAQYFGEHKRFCATFTECGVQPPASAHYFYFLREDEVAGGSDSETTVDLESRARDALKALKITPHASNKTFVAAAVGHASGEQDLDVWYIDERGVLIHVVGELD